MPATCIAAITNHNTCCSFVLTAGLSGVKDHAALMETPNIIEADIRGSSQLIISFAKTKAKEDAITDEQTKKK